MEKFLAEFMSLNFKLKIKRINSICNWYYCYVPIFILLKPHLFPHDLKFNLNIIVCKQFHLIV